MPSEIKTNLLIVGAGPFGLALSTQASQLGIEHLLAGKPMEFWQNNMPKGMYLRSACDWHLDPLNIHTIEAFLSSQGKTPADVEPLSLHFYQTYAAWFQQQKGIVAEPHIIEQLDLSLDDNGFTATTRDGLRVFAHKVVLAPGFKNFANVPSDLRARLPEGRFSHTCDFVDFEAAKGKQYLIVGGRQSAFEWAALLLESGAGAVHISHRHDSPAFAVSDWSWVNPLVDRIAEDPNWFRQLSQEEKDALEKRLWAEGRLKVEPWLEARLNDDRVRIWPRTELEATSAENGSLVVQLNDGNRVTVDQIVLATGYKVKISQLPYLAAGNILGRLKTQNGFPVLDDHFQTSIPGLFITSMPATQDFGPFFGFTIAVRASAKLICEAVVRSC